MPMIYESWIWELSSVLRFNEGEADVQVFDGEVELYQPNGEQRLVTAGNAITHAASGVFELAELTPDEFLGLEALDDRVRNQKEDRYQRWLRSFHGTAERSSCHHLLLDGTGSLLEAKTCEFGGAGKSKP